MKELFKTIDSYGIVPVTKIDNAKDAVPLAKALAEGGLPIIEVTFRTDAATKAIENISNELKDVLVGAGTVTNVEKAKEAVNAGARFIVSPGFNKSVVQFCRDNDVPMLPGCSNPTDIEMAIDYGFEVVKFFPAEAYGGIASIKALAAPYSNILFVPTGGINENNLNDYLVFPKVLAVGGSWLTPANIVREGKFSEITKIAKRTVQEVLGFEFAHIGINSIDCEQAIKTAKAFSSLFGFELKNGISSVFSGSCIEVIKSKGLGELGHIAIRTNNMSRAIAYFERAGVEINYNSEKKKDNKILAIFLKEEIGGFAVHLLQK